MVSLAPVVGPPGHLPEKRFVHDEGQRKRKDRAGGAGRLLRAPSVRDDEQATKGEEHPSVRARRKIRYWSAFHVGTARSCHGGAPGREAVLRALEAQVLPERAPLVLRPEEAASLELGDDELDEVPETRRQRRRHHVEPVRGASAEPALELVDDLLGCPDDLPVPTRPGDPEIEV